MAENKYNLIVIGAGPGGYHAAIRGAPLGMKVCLIEKDDGTGNGGLGGVCLNWGCIPSKSLLRNAELLNEMKNPDEWGFSFKEFKYDISKAIDRSREVSKKLTQGIEFLVKKNKIDLVINTTEKKQAIIDSFTIRRTSVDLNIPYYTNLRSAEILIKSLITLKNKPISVKPIQIHHSF